MPPEKIRTIMNFTFSDDLSIARGIRKKASSL